MTIIALGRYDCPNDNCTERFTHLGDKRRHLRDKHATMVKRAPRNGRKNREGARG